MSRTKSPSSRGLDYDDDGFEESRPKKRGVLSMRGKPAKKGTGRKKKKKATKTPKRPARKVPKTKKRSKVVGRRRKAGRRTSKPLALRAVIQVLVFSKDESDYCHPECHWFSGSVFGFCLLFRENSDDDGDGLFPRCSQCLELKPAKKAEKG